MTDGCDVECTIRLDLRDFSGRAGFRGLRAELLVATLAALLGSGRIASVTSHANLLVEESLGRFFEFSHIDPFPSARLSVSESTRSRGGHLFRVGSKRGICTSGSPTCGYTLTGTS